MQDKCLCRFVSYDTTCTFHMIRQYLIWRDKLLRTKEVFPTSLHEDDVLGTSCNQAKHTAVHVFPGQKMPTAKATFSQPDIIIYVNEKD